MNNFKVDYQAIKSDIIGATQCTYYNNNLSNIRCLQCNNYLFCKGVAEKSKYKNYNVTYNASVRYAPNGVELIYYKNDKKLSIKDKEYLDNVKKIDNSRLFRKNDEGVFEVCKDTFSYINMYRSICNSRKRALNNFYSYALANEWEYFITLTFSPEYVDRFDDFAVKEKWSIFEKWVKKKNPGAKILVVPEYHKENEIGKRAIHFHGFLSDVPNITFTPAINTNTGEYIYSKYLVDGKKVPRLNIKDWMYGFSTADLILDHNNFRCANYMQKYMFKGQGIGYQQKTFYNTRNLFKCYSDLLNVPKDNLSYIQDVYNLEVYKENDDFIVLRTKSKE